MYKISISYIFVLLVFLECNFSKKNETALLYSKHTKIINFLKKSEYIKLKLNSLGYKTSNLHFKVAKKNIKPSLLSLQTIFYQDSLYKTTGDKINAVITDSLKILDNLTKTSFFIKTNKSLAYLTDKSNANWMIFFTDIGSSIMYCEILYDYSSNLNYTNNSLSYFGTALTFLIYFNDDDDIMKISTGTISYN
jgi:hypothetical protein